LAQRRKAWDVARATSVRKEAEKFSHGDRQAMTAAALTSTASNATASVALAGKAKTAARSRRPLPGHRQKTCRQQSSSALPRS
jgi:hypothetical protein